MKTLNSTIVLRPTNWFTLAFLSWVALTITASAQTATTTTEPTPETAKIIRPEKSDATSQKLIANYLAASGGLQAHRSLKNIRVSGELSEGKERKNFELIESTTGQRLLRLNWTHRGVPHEHLYGFDGESLWQQRRLPSDGKRNLPKNYNGQAAAHFQHQRWFYPPFTQPLRENYVFTYEGVAKSEPRPSYLLLGYGPKNERSWFYFDQEKFLVTRAGGIGMTGSAKTDLDYRATGFKAVNDVLLPTGFVLLAKGQPYGTITFETIEANIDLPADTFTRPVIEIPTLRGQATNAD